MLKIIGTLCGLILGVVMFFNVFIRVDKKEQLTTDCFYYNAENHYLNYHSPYQDKDSWVSVPNVECEIKIDRPMIYITAKTIEGLI